ncbi:hypothetical protein [uncultured Sneathiella sp.]|jgi:hypothetical protein|uniref:hypothetical protein n=1 Tax=uncultured Sneathiella sp. TaxID=879315 RepID=UPI0030DD10AA|tara:strand:+ start:1844 stop:2275 length:432 start_codon:yes stop_codon:yes gene_type:complete
MLFYAIGAFGHVFCLVSVATVVLISTPMPSSILILTFFTAWVLYAFISGILATPYNDIVARSIPSNRRSRLLAWRFFAGGILALGVAIVAGQAIGAMAFPVGHAIILFMGAGLLLISSVVFISAGEPPTSDLPEVNGFLAISP